MKITPYFGNVYIDQFIKDCQEIREHGFDTIVHPVPEIDFELHSENIKELIRATKQEGFTCFVDPQSVGNLFGYGNISNFLAKQETARITDWRNFPENHVCPNDPNFQYFFYKWIELCREADWILWDEPNLSRCYCKRCSGKIPMLPFLREMSEFARENFRIQSSVCFWGGRIHPETYNIAQIVDDVGVSIAPEYRRNWGHTDIWLAYIEGLSNLFKKSSSVWFPGYTVATGEEKYIHEAIDTAKDHDIDNIGTWGFRGCEGWSYARCARPKVMWEEIGQAFRAI